MGDGLVGRRILSIAGLLAALTCAYTWPLVLHPRSTIPHDLGDPLLVTWLLWWSTHVMPLTTAWWNAPAFYPAPGVFAFSENLLGLAPVTWPIIAVTGAPVLAYNVAFALSYVFCGLGAYFLGFVLTRRRDAAFVAAIAFAFAPYRLSHTHHLQLLSAYWMPVAIGALHLYLADPKKRWAALFALAWLMQALACGYYFFFLSLLVVLWLAWFAPGRLAPRDAWRLVAAWAAAGIVMAPLLWGYRSIQSFYGFHRGPVEILNYSADIAGLWSASPDSLLWHGLHGAVSSESEQFPGVTVLLLTAFALVTASLRVRRSHALPLEPHRDDNNARDRYLAFYVVASMLVWSLSLGPAPALNGRPLGIPGPYALLALVPGFDAMRVPARLWMLAALCLSAVAAMAVSAIGPARTRRWTIAAATLGLLLDGWPGSLAIVPVPPMRTTSVDARARLGLPMGPRESSVMYEAIAQARPVFNGYSGYLAPQQPALRNLLDAHDPRILARMAATDPVEVVIDAAEDADGAWRGYVASQPGATLVDADPKWFSYLLPPTGAVAAAPPGGAPVNIVAVSASTNQHDVNAIIDGDLVTRWHAASQQGGETITVDLGSPQRVAALEMCLGAYPSQYPRQLAVDASADGTVWTPVYTGGTALATYDAALRSPREVPVAVPVQLDHVRFLRLRQTGRDLRAGWSIVELRVVR